MIVSSRQFSICSMKAAAFLASEGKLSRLLKSVSFSRADKTVACRQLSFLLHMQCGDTQKGTIIDEPPFEVDDFTAVPFSSEQGIGPRRYYAKAVQDDVQASIELLPAPNEAPGSYKLMRHCDRSDPNAPGKFGRLQDNRARALLEQLTQRVYDELLKAGWTEQYDLWRYSGPPSEKTSQNHCHESLRT